MALRVDASTDRDADLLLDGPAPALAAAGEHEGVRRSVERGPGRVEPGENDTTSAGCVKSSGRGEKRPPISRPPR